MNILKFGGTSVKDASAITRLSKIIANEKEPALIVVSALATITNSLVEIVNSLNDYQYERIEEILREIKQKHIHTAIELGISSDVECFIDTEIEELRRICFALDILGDVSPKSIDMILAKGELLSSRLIFFALKKDNFSIAHIDPREIMKTDSNFGEANVDFDSTKFNVTEKVFSMLKENKFVITGGFVGSDSKDKTTTLGRGGSDYSAAIFGAALEVKTVQIWTDVDGMLTCDPRIIKSARLIDSISYQEAAELAFFGAKVLHPKTIYPAVEKNIPVFIRNSSNPNCKGTKIGGENNENLAVKAIAFRKGIAIININSNRMLGAYGFLARTFEVFNKHKLAVDIIATTEVSISLTIDVSNNINLLIQELREFANIEVFENKAIIALVGEGIRDTAGIAARFFGALNGVNISMVSVGASEINISIVVNENALEKSITALHKEFFELLDMD